MHLPIRTRLTLLFAVIMAVVLAATGAFVYNRVKADLRASVDAGLRSRMDTLLPNRGVGGFFDEGSQLIEPDEAFSQLLAPVEYVVQQSSEGLQPGPLLTREQVESVTRPTYFETRVNTTDETVPARLLAVLTDNGSVLVLGAALDDVNEAADRLLTALLWGGGAALVITTLIGWFVAGAALRPVETLRREAAEITAEEPGRRLHVPDTGDEIAALSATLNNMLARIEESIEKERRFVDDASHEIRTPLGILKTELELALRRSRSVEELEAALRSAAEESDRLIDLAEDLLVLARADRGKLPVRREPTDLAALVRDVSSQYEPIVEQRNVRLEVKTDPQIPMEVDPLRIRQALGNLIDNALRHAPEETAVSVSAGRNSDAVVVEVQDEGAGFPGYFLDHAFEPFTRADRGRTRSVGGAGLGLAIVKAIVEGHGGRVEARNAPGGGAIVSMRLP